MSVSFSNSNGAFTITDSVSGIVWSGNAPLHFQKQNNKIAIYGTGDGWDISLPSYSLSEITTIGGNPVSGTIDGAINQLSALLPSPGGGGGSFDGQLVQDGSDVSASNPLPVSAQGGILGSDGVLIYPDNLSQTIAYNSDGTVNYIQVVAASGTYRQTLSYTNGVVTTISNWVKQ